MTDQENPNTNNSSDPNKLFVSNLDPTFSNRKIENDLQSLFASFGNLQSINVRRNEKLRKVFAFVLYHNPEQASSAIQNLDGEYFGDLKLKVEKQRGRRAEGEQSLGSSSSSLVCYRCGRSGHFARFCTQKTDGREGNRERHRKQRGVAGGKRDRIDERKRRQSSGNESSSRSRSQSRVNNRRGSSSSSGSDSSN